jgi:RNA polymerase sigma factor (sigma-70 family)
LQAIAYLILRDRLEAEDVVIETLLTAFERGASIRDERALRSWLLRVATNQALARRRRTARLVRLDVAPDAAGPRDLASDSSNRLTLLDGIASLPLQMRAALVLRYYADLPVEDVATALGKSPNTIKAQLQTALDRLRAHLADPAGASFGEARHA